MRLILQYTCFVLFYILSGLVFWGNHYYMLTANIIASFILPYYLSLKKCKSDFFILNMPFFSLILITSIFNNDFSRSLPYLIFIPISSCLGFILKENNKIFIFLFFIFLIMISNVFQVNYFNYEQNISSQKTTNYPEVLFTDKNKKAIKFEKDKIIVLDFWTTSCSLCFKKFPDLEKISSRFKNNPKVKIYSVNVPLKNESFSKNSIVLDKLGYTFPKLYASSFEEVELKLKINTFPHLLIIKNNMIRFEGMLIIDDNVLINKTEDQINLLLEE